MSLTIFFFILLSIIAQFVFLIVIGSTDRSLPVAHPKRLKFKTWSMTSLRRYFQNIWEKRHPS